jgi:hypothetical protein
LPETNILNLDPTSPQQSIAAVLADLDDAELNRLAIDVILEQRRRLEHAQDLFDRIEKVDTTREKLDDLRHHYRLALLMMKAHHQIASAVIDKLGYVPNFQECRSEH